MIALLFLSACAPALDMSSSPAINDNKPKVRVAEESVSNDSAQERKLSPEPKLPQMRNGRPDSSSSKNDGVQFNLSNESSSSPVISCEEDCRLSCKKSALEACSSRTRSDCKASCGDIIVPSACTQACAYLNQRSACQSQFERFCSAQCAGLCK